MPLLEVVLSVQSSRYHLLDGQILIYLFIPRDSVAYIHYLSFHSFVTHFRALHSVIVNFLDTHSQVHINLNFLKLGIAYVDRARSTSDRSLIAPIYYTYCQNYLVLLGLASSSYCSTHSCHYRGSEFWNCDSQSMSLLFKHLRIHQVFGANTDVGKTLLTSALVRASAALGNDVYYLKPVSTGPMSDADDELSIPPV